MSALASVAARLPLAWARCYTAGLPSTLRERRLAEIRSDTFEHLHDPSLLANPLRQAWDILQSFLRGLPDDLRWRAVNTPAGLWIVEVIALSFAFAVFGASCVDALSSDFTRSEDRAGIATMGAGLGIAFGSWLAFSLRRSATKDAPFYQLAAEHSPADESRGSPVIYQSFARFSGWLLILAGTFQAVSFAAGAAGGYDYFSGAEEFLNTVGDKQGLFVVTVASSALTAPLLIPFFAYLFAISRAEQRAWTAAGIALISIHVALSMAGTALYAVQLPIARDFVNGTGANTETLLAQAKSFMQLSFLIMQPAGVAMAAAVLLASVQAKRLALIPRWLMILGFVHALLWMPPVAGNFILAFPLFITWTIGIGLATLRAHGQSEPLPAALPA